MFCLASLAIMIITRFPISQICLDWYSRFLEKRFFYFIFLAKNSIPATCSSINIHFKDPSPLPTFHLWPLKVWLMLGRWGNINLASNAIFANCCRSWGEGHIFSFNYEVFWSGTKVSFNQPIVLGHPQFCSSSTQNVKKFPKLPQERFSWSKKNICAKLRTVHCECAHYTLYKL